MLRQLNNSTAKIQQKLNQAKHKVPINLNSFAQYPNAVADRSGYYLSEDESSNNHETENAYDASSEENSDDNYISPPSRRTWFGLNNRSTG